jgi:hypothetical protein
VCVLHILEHEHILLIVVLPYRRICRIVVHWTYKGD